jgi:hypothetical protein
LQQSVAHHLAINFEAWTQRVCECANPSDRKLEDHVDVVGRSRFALKRARETASDEVRTADTLDRGRDLQRHTNGVEIAGAEAHLNCILRDIAEKSTCRLSPVDADSQPNLHFLVGRFRMTLANACF